MQHYACSTGSATDGLHAEKAGLEGFDVITSSLNSGAEGIIRAACLELGTAG